MARHIAMSMRQKKHVFWIDYQSLDSMMNNVNEIKTILPWKQEDLDTIQVRYLLAEQWDMLRVIDNLDERQMLEYVRKFFPRRSSDRSSSLEDSVQSR